MELKKTISVLCLLASTALVHAAPTYTYLSTQSTGPYSGVSGMAYANSTLYLGYGLTTLIDGTTCAVVNSISNFNGASPATSTSNTYNAEAGSGILSLAINPTNNNLYGITTGDENLISFNESTAPSFGSSQLAFGQSGNIYGDNEEGLFQTTIEAPSNPYTDTNSAAATLAAFQGMAGGSSMVLAVKPGGDTVFVLPFNSEPAAIVNSTFSNGAFGEPTTVLDSVPIGTRATGMTFDSTGTYLYVWNNTASNHDTKAVYVFDVSGNLVHSIENSEMGLPRAGSDHEPPPPYFNSAVTTNNDQYLLLSDGNNVYVFSIYNSSGSPSPVLVTMLNQNQMFSDMFTSLSSVTTPHGQAAALLNLPQATNLVDSTTTMPDKMAKISTTVNNNSFPSAIANVAINAHIESPQEHSQARFSFTPTQRAAFKNLNQKLLMLQFQSLESTIDPIVGPISYGATATPFEQPKMTLKPVFLANDNHHIWIQPYGGLQRLDSYDQVTGYSIKTFGTAMGVGAKIMPDVILGVLVGGALNSYTQDQSSGDGNVNNYYAGLYGGYAKPERGFHIDGSAVMGKSRYTADRNLAALGLVAKGTHNGWDASGQVQGGYKFKFGTFSVDPFAGLGVRYSYQNSYQETNAYPFNLSVPSSTSKTATIELGMKFQESMMFDETMVNPIIGLSAYREQPLAKKGNITMNFTDGGNSFAVPVSSQVKTFAKLTVGFASMFTSGAGISALVTGKIRRHEQSVEALLKVSYAF